jgi:hypothetical protein
MKLPPPDPHESLTPPDLDEPMPAPVVYFAGGVPSDEVRRVTDAFLDLRPGALVIFAGR